MASKFLWNMLMSVFDPEIESMARKIADSIPANHPLRSQIVERVIGVVKAWVESYADKASPVSGAVLEKITDFGDFFAASLGDAQSTITTGKGKDTDWMDQFFKEASQRLARTNDLTGEMQKLEFEFQFRLDLLKMIEDTKKAMAPVPTSSAVSVDWHVEWDKVKGATKKVASKVDQKAGEAAPHVKKFRLWLERKGVR